MTKLFYVVYRTGGTENAEWRRTVAMSKADAIAAQGEVEKGGRKALVVEKQLSDAIGLPVGYEYHQSE